MPLILAADPGNKGHFALLDTRTAHRLVDHWPMPLERSQKNQAKGSSVSISPRDVVSLFRRIEIMYGRPDLYVVEQVGGIKGQSASASFVFGQGFGVILTAGDSLLWPRTTVPAVTWTSKMRAPSDKGARPAFAANHFPSQATEIKKGGDGLADAAMLAVYAARHILAVADH